MTTKNTERTGALCLTKVRRSIPTRQVCRRSGYVKTFLGGSIHVQTSPNAKEGRRQKHRNRGGPELGPAAPRKSESPAEFRGQTVGKVCKFPRSASRSDEHNQRNKRQGQQRRNTERLPGLGGGRKSDRFAEFRGEAFGDISDPSKPEHTRRNARQHIETTSKTDTPRLFHLGGWWGLRLGLG